jgi:uncharacterized protein (TIGR00369 family)
MSDAPAPDASPPPPDIENPNDKPLPDEMSGAMAVLDITLESMSPKRVVATMPVTPRHHQPFGVLHGGVSVLLAESAVSIGAYLAAPAGKNAVGVEINANHLRPMRRGQVTAEATPLHVGRTTQVWQVDIRNDDGKRVCVSRCTVAIVDAPEKP